MNRVDRYAQRRLKYSPIHFIDEQSNYGQETDTGEDTKENEEAMVTFFLWINSLLEYFAQRLPVSKSMQHITLDKSEAIKRKLDYNFTVTLPTSEGENKLTKR